MQYQRPQDIPLFEDLSEPLPLSPGEQNQLDTLRREWRRRQRKSRALRRLNARVQVASAQGVGEQNQAIREREDAYNERIQQRADADDPTLWPWIVAHHRVWVAILLGGTLASRVFDLTDGKHFAPPFDLIFEAARSVHRRGLSVTSKAVDRELKKAGIVLLPIYLQKLDAVLSGHTLVQNFSLDEVAFDVEHSKKEA